MTGCSECYFGVMYVEGVRCCELCGCVNGSPPVRCVLSLFYLCIFQVNPVCVVTSEVCYLFIGL